MDYAIRFADDGTLEGWLVPYGGSFDGKDSYNTYAAPDTDFCLDYFESRPLLYRHGFDPEIRATPIGKIVSLEKRDRGIWMKAQVDLHNEYISEIKQLVKKGAVGLSSGAIAHLVDIDARSGKWNRWPIAEGSIVPDPSNLLATIETVGAFKSHVRAAGIEVDESLLHKLEEDEKAVDPEYIEQIRAKLTSKERDNLDDSEFAYIDSKGGRHLPVNDKIHAQEALDRFNQTTFESDEAKEKARRKIMAAAKKFGIEVSSDDNAARSAADSLEKSFEDIRSDIMDALNPPDPFGIRTTYSYVLATYPDYVVIRTCSDDDDDTFYRVPYTMNDQSEPELDMGAATEVEWQLVEVAARSAVTPLASDAQRLTREAAALAERTKDLQERRYREGRVLSKPNRQLLSDAHQKMGEAHQALGDLLARTDATEGEVARAALPDDVRLQLDRMRILSAFGK